VAPVVVPAAVTSYLAFSAATYSIVGFVSSSVTKYAVPVATTASPLQGFVTTNETGTLSWTAAACVALAVASSAPTLRLRTTTKAAHFAETPIASFSSRFREATASVAAASACFC
jgi:hypothetical protein